MSLRRSSRVPNPADYFIVFLLLAVVLYALCFQLYLLVAGEHVTYCSTVAEEPSLVDPYRGTATVEVRLNEYPGFVFSLDASYITVDPGDLLRIKVLKLPSKTNGKLYAEEVELVSQCP